MSDIVVLAFSGGLDTSWCVPWLLAQGGPRVVTVTVDVGGFSAAERQAVAARSAALGAAEHRWVDARRSFFDEVLRFLIAGNVLRGGIYPLSVGAERGIQAREVARVARALGARAVCHGSTAAGNDQVRFEVALRTVAPELEVLAPIRDLGPSRAQEVADLEAAGLPVPAFGADYSVNAGLWGVTIGGKETRSSELPLPESAWVRTRGAFAAPRAAERHAVGFDRGVPSAFDGRALDPVAVIETVDAAAAALGIGRGIHLGDTILGAKGRVAFEAPAATVLIAAHRELEKLTLTRHQQRVKDVVAAVYGELVHEGQHLDPACRDVEALLARSQERVSGEVQVLLRQGACFVEGARSPYSLLAASRGVYGEMAGEWTAADARGLSRLAAMPGMLHTRAGERGAADAADAATTARAGGNALAGDGPGQAPAPARGVPAPVRGTEGEPR